MKSGRWMMRPACCFPIVWILLLAAPAAGPVVAAGPAVAAGGALRMVSSAEMWTELQERRPYPYLIPLPEPKPSALDGTYTKVVVSATERVHCLRCPDYAPEGGVWKMRLDKGEFRIFHPESGWKSIATFLVAGDRLLLANDPVCIDDLGLYRWRMEEGELILDAIDDPCAIRLRALNLTRQPWRSCRPPGMEAAVTEHWPKPEGCD